MPQVGGEAVWHEKNRGPIQRNRWTPRLKHEPTRKQWKKLIIAWQSSISHALRFYDAVFTVCMRACKKNEGSGAQPTTASRRFPSQLLPKGNSDVNIIPCVYFPFKQYWTKKEKTLQKPKSGIAHRFYDGRAEGPAGRVQIMAELIAGKGVVL